MYGDMSVVGADAVRLRTIADTMRTRASSLKADAGGMAWNSTAAQAFRLQIDVTANDLGSSAATLDAAASALEAHAREVDARKALIKEAEAFVSSVLDRAVAIAVHTREVVSEVAEDTVNGMMTVLSSVVTGPVRLATVLVHNFNGQEILESTVDTARQIAGTVPTRPSPGSKEWLDLQDTFKSRGWFQ